MISYFIRHPTAANLLMVLIFILGIIGATSMNREIFPDFESGLVNVQVIYRGASPEDVEENVIKLIEEELDGVQGIEKVTTISREGLGMVSIEAQEEYDLKTLVRDVKDEVDKINNFPVDIEEPVVTEVKREDSVILITLFGNMPEKDLLKYSHQLKDELIDLDGVSLIDISGFSKQEMRIEIYEDALLSYGVTIQDLSNAIRNQSIDLPSGSLETGEKEIKIRITDKRRNAKDFEDIPVLSSINGGYIPLKSLAKVTDTFQDDWNKAFFNGKRAVTLTVNKTKQEDAIYIADKIRDYMKIRQETFPEGLNVTVWGDRSKPILERMNLLIRNGIQGFVLVFFTLWFFLNIRLSFWVVMGIPVAFMGTLYILNFLDMSLNMITMFSLIMALGIVVDDAIVLGENIYSHVEMGEEGETAAKNGIKEVALGVVSSLMTTIAIFMPLLFMVGQVGKIMKFMPVGVIAALVVSFIEGFLILPNHLTHSLKQKKIKEVNKVRKSINDGVQFVINNIYGPLVKLCLNFRGITVALVILIFFLSLGQLAGGRLRFTPFPKLDGDIVTANILLPPGASYENTHKVAMKIEKALEEVNQHFTPEQPKEQPLVLYYNTVYGANSDADETGSNTATITAELLSADIRNTTADDTIEYWKNLVGEVPGVVNLTFKQRQVTPGGRDIEIQIQGNTDLSLLKKASEEMQNKLSNYPAVYNLSDTLRLGKDEIQIKLRETANLFNLKTISLAQQLQGAFFGSMAQEFQGDVENVEVRLKLHDSNRNSIHDIENFKIITPQGHRIPFYEVANAKIEKGYSKITRINGYRTVSVVSDINPRKGNAEEILTDIEKTFFPEFKQKYPQLNLKIEGQRSETQKTQKSVSRGFILGLSMIFIILSFVFKSYSKPIVVMLAIPFGFIGAIWGHVLTGINWTIPSTIGFVSLSGIVINDSIILVEFIKINLDKGYNIYESIVNAGKDRFRAVLLTSATTVAGLLPILTEKSMQAQFLIPMATSIAFGLMFATVLVLLLIPTLYSLFVSLKIIRD